MGMHPLNTVNDHDILWNVIFDSDRESQLNKMVILGLLEKNQLNQWRKFLSPISHNSREWANTIDNIFFKTSNLLEGNSYLSSKSPRDITSNLIQAGSLFGINLNSVDNIRGKVFLDIGSGVYRPFNVSTILYCNGFDRTYAFEPYPLQTDFAYFSFQKLIERMSNHPEEFIFSGVSIDEFIGRLKTLIVPNLYSKIKSLNKDADESLNLGGLTFIRKLSSIPRKMVNFHFSNAVLEHIIDINKFMIDLREIVTADSIGIHIVDFLDHRHYNDSSISPVQKYFDGILDEINGLTPPELENIFLKSNWNVDKINALRIPENYISSLSHKIIDRYTNFSIEDLTQHINFYKITMK